MRRSVLASVCLSIIGSALLMAESSPGSRPFTVQDMVAMQRVSDPQVSPDGRRIAFVLRSTDLKADRGRTDLWLTSLDGSLVRRLTTHPAADFNPRWSADGKDLFFLSTRSGSSQVWRLPIDGGEAVQVTRLPLDAGNLIVSPDGTRLALTMEVFADCGDLDCTLERLEERRRRKSSGQAYDQLFVRHWDAWKDGRRSHIYVIPSSGGKAVAVMKGMDADAPSKPFGGPEEMTFSADGRSLVFAARDVGRQEPWSTDFDLFEASVDGSSPPRNLTDSNPAWDTAPSFSPDGKRLAYLAMKRAGFEADRFSIMIRDWPQGEARELAPAWDRSPSGLAWSRDGRTLFASASNLGQRSIFAIDAATGAVRTVVEKGYNAAPSPAAGGSLVFSRDDLRSPAELHVISNDGSGLRALTSFNRESLSDIRMGDFEQFTFAGWKGQKVYAYVVRPVDFDSSREYPVAFLIHGGPQGSFGNHFHYRWNPQAYAGAGYAALMIDFHGSTGYGQDFTDSISGDWGGKPLEDLQKGLEAALKRYPWMDEERIGALGASYGGYMVNWIAGNWSDAFQCLVNHDGIFDMRMMYYATEELWFPEWEHGGPYWKNPEGFEKHNPANHVDEWKTPMLVIHGQDDHRVPLEQGLATFTALQRKGVPSRFLYFPDENHWVLRPSNSIQWHHEVLGWLDRWLKR